MINVMCSNLSKTITSPHCPPSRTPQPVHGKIAIYKTSPWCYGSPSTEPFHTGYSGWIICRSALCCTILIFNNFRSFGGFPLVRGEKSFPSALVEFVVASHFFLHSKTSFLTSVEALWADRLQLQPLQGLPQLSEIGLS